MITRREIGILGSSGASNAALRVEGRIWGVSLWMFWQLRNVSITRTLLPIHLESDDGGLSEREEGRKCVGTTKTGEGDGCFQGALFYLPIPMM